MRLSRVFTTTVMGVALGFSGQGQNAASQNTTQQPAQGIEAKGMPARSSPNDYQAHAQAGSLTIAADFDAHSVPRPEGPLSTENFVVVEAGLFGAPGTPLKMSVDNFSLRINGKKDILQSVPYGMVVSNLRDPSWESPEEIEAKKNKSSGSGLSTGGNQNQQSNVPLIIHIPIEMQRSMAQYVQKSAFPEGERPLPEAGLLFFQFHAKEKAIHKVELIYAGPAGNATLDLTP